MRGAGIYPVHRVFFKELAKRLELLGVAERRMAGRASVAALPLWEILNHLRIPIGIIDGYYLAFPAPHLTAPSSYFFAYGLDGLVAHGTPGVPPADLDLFVQPPERFAAAEPFLAAGDFHWQSATLLRLLREAPQPRFVNFYSHQPDAFQHWYWKWLEPERYLGVDETERRAHGAKIPDLHRALDGFLGGVLDAVDPATIVVVISDHGHSATIVHRDQYSAHRHGPPGVIMLAGGPVKRGYTLTDAHIYDVFPTLLHLLGLPVPEDGDGRVLMDALDDDFLRRHPVRTVASYEGIWAPVAERLRAPLTDVNRAGLERLKALGYVH